MTRPVEVIYVAGYGRSGSTLLERLLADSLDAVPTGELRQIWEHGLRKDFRCGCGAQFSSCPFWTSVGAGVWDADPRGVGEHAERLQRRWVRNLRIPRLAKQGARSVDPELRDHCELLARLYGTIREVAGTRYVIDSTKSPAYAHLLARVEGIELFVIHLIRDSRAVAYSWTRPKARPETPDGRLMRAKGALRGAVEWSMRNAWACTLRNAARGYVRVWYEDLARDPEATIAETLGRLGLQRGAETAARRRAPHTVGGNPVRFVSEAPRVRLDERWRTEAPLRQRMLVTLVTWPLLVAWRVPRRPGVTR